MSSNKKKSIVEEMTKRGAAGIASTTKGRSRVFTSKKAYNRNLWKKGSQE